MSAYAVLIPARYASTRLPAKALLSETGRPLVQYVWERARAAPGAPRVLVLTDDERIECAVQAFGGEVRRTRADHPSGTDRCAEAARDLTEPVVVNVQGDEPFFEPADLGALVGAVGQGADVATLGAPFADAAARAAPSAVKALVGPGGWAVGFQRAWPAEEDLRARGVREVLHHVGIYAFRRERLLEFPRLAPTAGEQRERLEQLRALEHGWRVRVLRASAPGFGVDTPEDYAEFVRRVRAAAGPGA